MSAGGDVEFNTGTGVNPPEPRFLQIHAAFAKVLHLSGAAEYVDRVERETEKRMESISGHLDDTDFASLLHLKLSLVTAF